VGDAAFETLASLGLPPTKNTQSMAFSASSRLIGLNGETNSLKKKKSSATIVADVTAAAGAAQRSNWV
jgi:hypothetical protein